jgi:predicted RNase H-like HicB family nuclease
MELEEYLAIPYILRMESASDHDGNHVCRAEHPELCGCNVEARSPVEALDLLEAVRRRIIEARFASGEPIPVPRAPLPDLLSPRRRQPPRLLSIAGGAP